MPLAHEKVKIKDVSKGENLSEVPKDGRLDTPLLKERLALVLEMIEEINLGNLTTPRSSTL